jgi:hypothetical protein
MRNLVKTLGLAELPANGTKRRARDFNQGGDFAHAERGITAL